MKEMKKTRLARRLTLLLAAVLLFGAITPTLTACTPDVLSLDGVEIDREMYAFWFSMCKTDMMRRYGIKSTQDNAAFWSSKCSVEGKTDMSWGEVVNDEVHRAIKAKLAAALLYDEKGLTMTDPQKDKVKSYIDDMIEYVADGDKGALKEELERYGSSLAALRRCAAFDMRAELVLAYLARNGKTELTSEEKAGYYNDYYYRVKILYINKEVYGAFENGKRVEKPLSFIGPGARNDQDKAELAAILDTYYENSTLPEDFEARFNEYLGRSDEEIHGSQAYPDGIYVTRSINLSEGGLLEPEVYEAARGIRKGQLAHVTTENGDRYIYGYALETAAYDNEKLSPFFSGFYSGAADRALTARSYARIEDVVEFSEEYADITVYTVPCNLDFKLCTID